MFRRPQLDIISLTLTEFMLLFIFLLLILFYLHRDVSERKYNELEEQYTNLHKQSEEMRILINENENELEEQYAKLHKQSEEIRVLINENDNEELTEILIRTKQANQEYEKIISDITKSMGMSITVSHLKSKNNDVAEKIISELDNIVEKSREAENWEVSDSGNLIRENKKLNQELKQLKERLANAAGLKGQTKTTDQIFSILEGKLIGFTPCWKKENINGTIGYYETYKTIYKNGKYKITPIWDEGVPIVKDALIGQLSVLRDYPKGWVAAAQYARFGRKIRTSKNKMYGKKCRLVTTINKSANGTIIKYIFPHFYPIYRYER